MSRKRQDRFFHAVIALLCLCAAALVIVIALQSRESTSSPSVQTMVNVTPAPTSTADALPTVAPTDVIAATSAPMEDDFEYLPIYTSVQTSEKVIAITLDDCSDVSSLKYAASAAEHYGAKLTLLPIASNVLADENKDALIYCAFTLGYEIENRTLNNVALYSLSDFELANEIWTADMAIDYALNMDYEMHLLRTKGGQGLKDARTHAYLKQLGYDGFLTWSVDAAAHTADELKSSIQPGEIYLFNCTRDEVVKMAQFMEFAQSLGYRMVTVNELLGYEENVYADLKDDVLSRQLVELQAYDAPLVEYSDGDRAYGVYQLQLMLYEMGYLAPETAVPEDGSTPAPTLYLDSLAAKEKLVDGVFGENTRAAIMAFQAAHNLPCTGVASAEIQQMIQDEYHSR